jgi:mitochondrial import inner membrane translocase subunit TIM10
MSTEQPDSQAQAAAATAMALATTELEYRVELLNHMVSNCHEKCASKPYKDGQLSVGENSCVDRCSSKYWQVDDIDGKC